MTSSGRGSTSHHSLRPSSLTCGGQGPTMIIFFKDWQVFWIVGYYFGALIRTGISISKDPFAPVQWHFQWQHIVLIGGFNHGGTVCASCFRSASFQRQWLIFSIMNSVSIWAAVCWFNCVRVCAQSAPDDTFVSGSVSGHWMLFRNTKAAQKAVFTSTATLKGRNNVARRCGVSQQSHGTTSLNPKLICPHRLQRGGRKELPIVFYFCLQLHK